MSGFKDTLEFICLHHGIALPVYTTTVIHGEELKFQTSVLVAGKVIVGEIRDTTKRAEGSAAELAAAVVDEMYE